MKIDAPEPRSVDRGRADLLAKRDHDHQIRMRQRFAIDISGAQNGKFARSRRLGEGRGGKFAAAAGGAVRLRHNQRHLMHPGAQRLQYRKTEFAAAGENNSQSIHNRFEPITQRASLDRNGLRVPLAATFTSSNFSWSSLRSRRLVIFATGPIRSVRRVPLR